MTIFECLDKNESANKQNGNNKDMAVHKSGNRKCQVRQNSSDSFRLQQLYL